MLDSLIQEFRLTFRSRRRTPLFTAGTAGTIGLGPGILCSGFTILNADVLKPIDLPAVGVGSIAAIAIGRVGRAVIPSRRR